MGRVWAVVPAAGVGRRMAGDRPKQYLLLHNISILEHTLRRLLAYHALQRITVAVSSRDDYWPGIAARLDRQRVTSTVGGDERCHSVYNGLLALADVAGDDDWVLVHDAARPCVRLTDIERLMTRLASHAVGGLLAIPLSDTLKRAGDDGCVAQTVPREGLWRALTPQVFRYGLLKTALAQALESGVMVTDEAMAVERLGHRPLLVEGEGDNIKITRPADLALAGLYLEQQRQD